MPNSTPQTAETARSFGMILVSGPSQRPRKIDHVVCVPQEARKGDPHITRWRSLSNGMENIERIQLLPATGYTFAEALRHILRHDP